MFTMLDYILGATRRYSPIMQALKLVEKYNFLDKFIAAMFTDKSVTYEEGKNAFKLCIKNHDKNEWKSSCMMYGKLKSYYFKAQQNITFNVWYMVTNALPHLCDNVSKIMAIIMGSQPKGMQHNFNMSSCYLCHLHERDSPTHILFKCRAQNLVQARTNQWQNILSVMPPAMLDHVNSLNDEDKTSFILTGLNSSYIPEWLPIYTNISVYISQMYSIRDSLYGEMQVDFV